MNELIRKIRNQPRLTILLLVVVYIVGIFGLNINITVDLFRTLTPVTLLLSFGLLVIFHENGYGRKFWISIILIFLAGFFVEVAGVATGLIFGGYEYGPTLGVRVFETPLMIGLNWAMLTYCLWAILGMVRIHAVVKSLLGALGMVIYDIILEPMAIKYDMWSWEGGDVPLQNYIAWFVVSFVFFLLLSFFRTNYRNRIASAVIGIQFGFFVILNIISFLLPSV